MASNHLPPEDKVYTILCELASHGVATKEAAEIIDIGTDQFIDFFENEILNDYIEHGGTTCRFFEGQAGSGKTHILHLIESIALNKGYIVCYVELTNDLSFSEWDMITKNILEKMSIKVDGHIIKRFPDILAALERTKTINKDGLIGMQLEHPCFQNAIQKAIHRTTLDSESWNLIRSYLLGEKVLVSQFKSHKIRGVKKSLTKNNAEQVLNTTLNAIQGLGIKGTVIIFDETDRSWMLSSRKSVPRKVQVAANLIRRFIDGCSSGDIRGTVGIFAVLPNFIRDCSACYPALGSRLMMQHEHFQKIGWRWPLLDTNSVNSLFIDVEDPVMQRRIFLEEAKKKFKNLVEYCEGDFGSTDQKFTVAGNEELEKNSGENYKRAVIKTLAECSRGCIGIGPWCE